MSEDLLVTFPSGLPDQWPEILSSKREGATVVLTLFVPSSTHWFGGHFDNQPVLPGVAQVFWAEYFARALFTVPSGPFRIKSLKFSAMVLPGAELTLSIEHQAEKCQWVFRYSSDETVHSSGILAPIGRASDAV